MFRPCISPNSLLSKGHPTQKLENRPPLIFSHSQNEVVLKFRIFSKDVAYCLETKLTKKSLSASFSSGDDCAKQQAGIYHGWWNVSIEKVDGVLQILLLPDKNSVFHLRVGDFFQIVLHQKVGEQVHLGMELDVSAVWIEGDSVFDLVQELYSSYDGLWVVVVDGEFDDIVSALLYLH